MEIKKNVIMRTVAGEHMLVPVGDTVFQYNGIFMLTDSGKLLWDKIRDGAESEGLVKALIEEYEIDEATASKDVADFLEKLQSYEII
ncbi:MAG: PqqD family protein [Clostridia bacterium]|nr:PqqD family protein [Clostridia bacterium]